MVLEDALSTTVSPPPEPGTATPVATGTAEPVRPRRSGRGRSMMPLLLRLHFYAGVLVAPFLVVAALTGLLFMFTPQLDRLVYGDELPVDRVGERRRGRWPSRSPPPGPRTPTATSPRCIPPASGDETTRVVFSLPELGEKQHTVYVDPYTGEVQGTLTTWFGRDPADDLARRPAPQPAPRRRSAGTTPSWPRAGCGSSSSAALVAVAAPAVAGRRRCAAPSLPDLAAGKGVRRTRGWHAATGVWLAVGLLILSATGLTWSRYAGGNFDLVQDGLRRAQPGTGHRA